MFFFRSENVIGKAALFFCLVFYGFRTLAQNGESVLLRWKIPLGDSLIYKTRMQDVDSGGVKMMNANLQKMIPGLKVDSGWESGMKKASDMAFSLARSLDSAEYVSVIKRNKTEYIDVRMEVSSTGKVDFPQNDPSTLEQMRALKRLVNSGMMLRGTLANDGGIRSFYVKSDQRNLLAIMFELPNTAVRQGDSWEPDVHLLSVDQSFSCDSSFRSDKVTLSGFRNDRDGPVALLTLNMKEYVSGSFSNPFGSGSQDLSYEVHGTGEFSVNLGRWINFNALMTQRGTGLITIETSKKISMADATGRK